MRKYNLLLITFFIVISPLANFAQKVKLINSTIQSWSGGVAGRWGDNYYFELEFIGFKNELLPLPDTIWVEHDPILLTLYDSVKQQYGNLKRILKNKSVRFEISVGTSHDEYEDRFINPDALLKKKNEEKNAFKAYSGVALISFLLNGKKHYYQINRFMKQMEPINYP